MKTRNRFVILTTIHPKSEAISFYEKQADWRVVVVGDKKSLPMSPSANLKFLSVEEQAKLDFRLAGRCPFHHYSRKNIGYLYAIRRGADVIFDTDDDNTPIGDWMMPPFECDLGVVSDSKYINIYGHFTREFIWPRGFPVDEIRNSGQDPFRLSRGPAVKIGAWQGLTDHDPDTDAIYRLVLNKKIRFEKKEPVYLPKGRFCPVNSQNTFWNREVFPYLYLPVTVGFRWTDILRGYIAQALMWRQSYHIGFSSASLFQKRNPHDLMKDLSDEWESYFQIKRLIEVMEKTEDYGDPFRNLAGVYGALAEASLVKPEELLSLESWIEDFRNPG